MHTWKSWTFSHFLFVNTLVLQIIELSDPAHRTRLNSAYRPISISSHRIGCSAITGRNRKTRFGESAWCTPKIVHGQPENRKPSSNEARQARRSSAQLGAARQARQAWLGNFVMDISSTLYYTSYPVSSKALYKAAL